MDERSNEDKVTSWLANGNGGLIVAATFGIVIAGVVLNLLADVVF